MAKANHALSNSAQGGINSPTQFIDTAPEEDLQVRGWKYYEQYITKKTITRRTINLNLLCTTHNKQ